MEEESPLSLTEMKELRKAKKEQFEKEMMLAKLQKEKEDLEMEKKIEQEGVSWGMSNYIFDKRITIVHISRTCITVKFFITLFE